MQLARVDGNAVATIAHPCLEGKRLVICQPLGADGSDQGDPYMAVDPLGAGLHQRVFLTTDGRGIREWVGSATCPIRYLVIGLVDEEVPA